jgi:hypothetical protein
MCQQSIEHGQPHGLSRIRTPVHPTLQIRAQGHHTTVRARGVPDVTTLATLRSRRTKAPPVYHVREPSAGESPTSLIIKIQGWRQSGASRCWARRRSQACRQRSHFCERCIELLREALNFKPEALFNVNRLPKVVSTNGLANDRQFHLWTLRTMVAGVLRTCCSFTFPCRAPSD